MEKIYISGNFTESMASDGAEKFANHDIFRTSERRGVPFDEYSDISISRYFSLRNLRAFKSASPRAEEHGEKLP